MPPGAVVTSERCVITTAGILRSTARPGLMRADGLHTLRKCLRFPISDGLPCPVSTLALLHVVREVIGRHQKLHAIAACPHVLYAMNNDSWR